MPEAQLSGKQRALRLVLCGAAFIASIPTSVAADCAPEPQGEGRIANIIDARTVRLDDGRIVRLAGLAPLRGPQAERAAAALAAMAIGQTVSLNGDSDAPDRYGRQRAWVFAEGQTSSLQSALVAAGGGLRDLAIFDTACRQSLVLAETAARNAQAGLWAAPSVEKNAESPDDISIEIGHFSVIEGRVRSVRTSGGTTYLNFGRRWTQGFAAMVPGRSAAAVETNGTTLMGLEGKRLRVRGYVLQRGGPRIEVIYADQIEVVGGGAVATAGTRD